MYYKIVMIDANINKNIYIKAFFGDFKKTVYEKALSFIRNFIKSCPHKPSEETINKRNLKGITLKELLPEAEYSKLQTRWKKQDELHAQHLR